MEFEWDTGNRKHIARHAITPEEAEEVAVIEPLEAAVQQRESEERVLCFGRTKAGRLLTIRYTDATARSGSSRLMTKEQQRSYFEDK